MYTKSLNYSVTATSATLGPCFRTVEPVIDSGGVRLWFVKDLSTDKSGVKVATRIEHAPPHVIVPPHTWR